MKRACLYKNTTELASSARLSNHENNYMRVFLRRALRGSSDHLKTNYLRMKNILYLFFVIAITACNKQKITISGHIHSADTLMLYLEEVDVYESRIADSVQLTKNGRFKFSIKSDIPCFYQLRLSNNKNIILFPVPGEHIDVQADAGNIITSLVTTGSVNTKLATDLIQMCHTTGVRLDSLDNLYEKAESDEVKELLNQEYVKIIDAQRKYSISFILENYKSLASIYALHQQYRPESYVFYKTTDLQFFRILSDSLTKYIPESKHVIALKAYTNDMISDYQSDLIFRKAEDTDNLIPDISLPDFAGDTISLRSLKGRYVLLTFWISTSENSIEQNLLLKSVYNKYRKYGFEIYQVSFNSLVETWKKAVSFDELPWISVIDTSYPNSTVAWNFNISAVPQNYLIDRDQVNILAKNLTVRQLDERLKELYNTN